MALIKLEGVDTDRELTRLIYIAILPAINLIPKTHRKTAEKLVMIKLWEPTSGRAMARPGFFVSG